MVFKKVNKFGVMPPHVQNVSSTSKGNMLFYTRQIIACISLFISKDYVNNELMVMFFLIAFYSTNDLTNFYLTTFASLIKNIGSLRKKIFIFFMYKNVRDIVILRQIFPNFSK